MDDLTVQSDGTITQVVPLNEVKAELESRKGFLAAAQARKLTLAADLDAEIAAHQEKIDSLTLIVSQVGK